MSKNLTPGNGNRFLRLDTALGPRSSSSGTLNTVAIRFRRINISSGSDRRSREFLASAPKLFPRIVSSPAVSNRGLRDMETLHGKEGSNTSSTSPAFPSTGPVCSVPMLPTFDSQQNIIATQASPSSPPHVSASLDKIDGGNLYDRKLSKRNLMRRIKNKFYNLGRSSSEDRLSSNRSEDSESLLETMDGEEPPISEEEVFITSRLLEKCSPDTFIIQFHRNFPTQELGIFFSTDEVGLYISRLSKKRHLESIQEYLQVKDRIVSLQGIPAYLLNVDEIREVIRGSYVITIKIVRPFCR
ncbi:unnamed protein product [Hymenolepis diminuta]|uniref:PDZ domain-containing protein n=1 Tax=Hymenolepis diminuta TaxID=6216 RepID=A0A0R3SPC9_HYMDI|nr:unnamed protein product [Hymenolepis diminuta]